MFNDIMTRGVDVEGTIISKITWAALYDTGWYATSLRLGTLPTWGYSAGKDFFHKKCVSDNEPNFSEFCNDFGQHSACDITHTQVGRCNLQQFDYNHVPPVQYRYFWNYSWGGSDPYVDFCPYVQPYITGDCRNQNNADLAYETWGEKIGTNSKCINGDFAPLGYSKRNHGGCHEVTCAVDGFAITIGDKTINCPLNPYGDPLEVYEFPEDDEDFFGTVICPRWDIVCG